VGTQCCAALAARSAGVTTLERLGLHSHAGAWERSKSLLHLAEQIFDAAVSARDIRLLLHRLLAPHLGTKPLQSRELLKLSIGVKP